MNKLKIEKGKGKGKGNNPNRFLCIERKKILHVHFFLNSNEFKDIFN